jgi:hypothetical protein
MAKIQRYIGQNRKHKGYPKPNILSIKLCSIVIRANPAPKLPGKRAKQSIKEYVNLVSGAAAYW